MFKIIEPATVYNHGWHIDAISEHLEAVSLFQIEKLAIMMPPRHMKSICVSVMWPSWDWLKSPEHRFVFSSYAQSLSMSDGLKMRDIIRSAKYQQMFNPQWRLREDQDTKTKYENTKHGYRQNTSVDGASTGIGGDFIVGDDLISVKDAHSETKRVEAVRYWNEIMSTRGNNPKKKAHVLVMQRICENDPAGEWILKNPDVQVLKLPAEYEPRIIIDLAGNKVEVPQKPTCIGFVDPRRTEGELLWEAQFDRMAILDLKRTLGSLNSSAQLQQEPKPADGGKFKRSWWKYYKERPMHFIEIVTFWDCAEETNEGNDYSIGATWGRTAEGYYCLGLWRNKVQQPELLRAVQALQDAENTKSSAIVIEKKSAGVALYQTLSKTTSLPVLPFMPTVNKEIRASAATPTVEAGNCYLPEGAPWVEAFISEHESFPLGAHDDQVDTTSMMVEHFMGKGKSNARVRQI